MGNSYVEALPNGKFNLVVIDDNGNKHKIKLDSLYEDAAAGTTVLPTGLDTASINDAGRVKRIVSQSLAVTAFTDNTDATGYIDITTQLPALSIVLGWKAVVSAGFAGDTTAIIKIGKAAALADYSGVTSKSVFAAGSVSSGTPSATNSVDAATTARVTVTGSTDFTLIKTNAAGIMIVTLYYLDLTI